MTASPAQFDITIKRDIIFIKLQGVWTVSVDMAYISQLSQAMYDMRGAEWGMFVDMAQWTLPEEVYYSEFKTKIVLDRRNQIAESWRVNEMNQGELLLPFFSDYSLKPKRFLEENDAIAWLRECGLHPD